MTTLLFFSIALFTADLHRQENFIENPSFEENRNRDTFPDGWRPYAFDSPAKLAWTSSVARTGTHSLRISDSFRSGDQKDWKRCTGRWVSRMRPIRPGTEYKLEVWVKTKEVTGQSYAHIAWHRRNSWLSENPTKRVTGTTAWRRVTVTATAPQEADAAVVSLNLSRSKGTAWFDDVKITGISDTIPEVTYVFKDTSGWFPFVFPSNDTNLDSIDLTHLLHTPAGKHGFVSVKSDGRFYFADGRRARFFGTNVGGRSAAPEKSEAPRIAARLAKYGVNMLRLHAMDSRYGPLIDYSRGTSRAFNKDGLDRMDYFIAELKKRGIYIYMDLLDYRRFRSSDGVKHADEFTHNWQGSMKGASIFDERMIELQKEYAEALLTHRNPYTKLRYVDDPAVAVVETTNENSIFYFLTMTELSLPYYRNELTKRWNRWLTARYGERSALAEAWTDEKGGCALLSDEFPEKGTVALPFGLVSSWRPDKKTKPPADSLLAPLRYRDTLLFLGEIQRNYYKEMRSHLKSIGVRVPVAGTNQQFVMIDTAIDAMGDFMSRNQYWRHPHRSARPFYKFSNEAFLNVEIPETRNPLSVIARTSVAGKPQGVAEFNFPWPNEYRCEGLLTASAYACLQDWDLFLLFSYGLDGKTLSMFRSASDPARWGTFPAAALMFHRHDVRQARNEIHVVHTPEAQATLHPHTRRARYTNYRYLTFLSKVRNVFPQGTCRSSADVVLACGPSVNATVTGIEKVFRFTENPWEKWLYPKFVETASACGLPGYEAMHPRAKEFKSDTGQLLLNYGDGLLTINTPCTKGAIGYLAKQGEAIRLDGFSVECKTEFAAVTATSLDGLPIGRSRRILVTSVGKAENTAQGFWPPDPDRPSWDIVSWMLPAEGCAPVLVEPVRAVLGINMPGDAEVYTLDPTGRRQEAISSSLRSGRLIFDLGAARSIWCEIIGR